MQTLGLGDNSPSIREKESKLRTVIESVPNGIIMINGSGKIILANSELEKMFGYDRDELLDKQIEDLVPSRFRAKHPGYRENFAQSPSKRQMGAGRDLAGLRKDGTEIPVEIGLNHIQAGDGVFMIASIVDITERKRQEERFRTIVESVPSGIIMIDDSGTIVLSNSETERMFGYEKGELFGKKVEMLVPNRIRGHHPELRKQFSVDPQKRQMGAGRDLTGQRRDGSEIPVEIGLNPIHTGEGNYVLASIVDITERKFIETKLHKAYGEVQQKNEEMEQFVYTVSHDLKSPLVTSMSFLGFLREDLKEHKMEDVMDSLERLEKAHKRMQQLINDLLQLSRVGRLGLQPEEVHLQDILDDVIESQSEKINSKGIRIEVPVRLPTMVVDRGRIQQVFENLLNNALKYGMGEAELKVEILFKETVFDICICVKDHGPGIEKQYHKKIFALFQRLHNDPEGTGVGLAIVSRIMQLHGGHAWVESEPGKGAEFWLSFPKNHVISAENENAN